MIQKTWATLNPGDRVLGRNAGTVTDITPAHNGDGLLVRYAGGTARNVREPGETVCVLGVFAGQRLGLGEAAPVGSGNTASDQPSRTTDQEASVRIPTNPRPVSRSRNL